MLGPFPVARRRDRRRDKLLIAGWAVYDVQLRSRQGCRGAMAGYPGRYPRTQACQGPGWQAVGHTWAGWEAHRASPAGPSTARPWRGRASARPDKPSRFTTEACMSTSGLPTHHSTLSTVQRDRLKLRLSALSIKSPADAHPCSRSPRWRYRKGHKTSLHWLSSDLWLINNSFCG